MGSIADPVAPRITARFGIDVGVAIVYIALLALIFVGMASIALKMAQGAATKVESNHKSYFCSLLTDSFAGDGAWRAFTTLRLPPRICCFQVGHCLTASVVTCRN